MCASAATAACSIYICAIHTHTHINTQFYFSHILYACSLFASAHTYAHAPPLNHILEKKERNNNRPLSLNFSPRGKLISTEGEIFSKKNKMKKIPQYENSSINKNNVEKM